ncbi:MAG TPA: bifunctional adenosylcobinamide kinase/adenosylcobinamide-phosphate guanylyltransferase [Parvibaculum sp.]
MTLLLGGARSGKSRHAEELTTRLAAPWTYVATSEARDDEMAERIAEHRARRGDGWRTVDAPLDLVGAIAAASGNAVLVDCLTLWLSNLLHAERDIEGETATLEATLMRVRVPVFLVSNEVGLGIVPDNALARRFRDEAGRLHQRLAARADRVLFMVAGLPMVVK